MLFRAVPSEQKPIKFCKSSRGRSQGVPTNFQGAVIFAIAQLSCFVMWSKVPVVLIIDTRFPLHPWLTILRVKLNFANCGVFLLRLREQFCRETSFLGNKRLPVNRGCFPSLPNDTKLNNFQWESFWNAVLSSRRFLDANCLRIAALQSGATCEWKWQPRCGLFSGKAINVATPS